MMHLKRGHAISWVLLFLFLFSWCYPVAADVAETEKTIDETSEVPVPTSLKVEGSGRLSGIGDLYGRGMKTAGAAMGKAVSLFSTAGGEADFWPGVLDRLTDGKGWGYLIQSLFFALLIICMGLFFEWLLKRSQEDMRKQILASVPLGKLERLGRAGSRFLLNTLGIGVYALTTFILAFLICGKDGQDRFIVASFIVSSYYLRIFILAAGTLLSPSAPRLRLLPIEDEDAVFLYWWILRIVFTAASIVAVSGVFQLTGASPTLALLTYAAAGIATGLLILITILQSRERVAQAIRQEVPEGKNIVSLRNRLADRWHLYAVLYVLVMGGYWLIGVMTTGEGRIDKLIISIFIIPVFMGVDQWGRRLIDILYFQKTAVPGSEPSHDTGEDSGPKEEKSSANEPLVVDEAAGQGVQRFIPKMKLTLRILVLAFMFFMVLRLWGIDLPIGRFFTSTAINIFVALLLGLIAWEYVKVQIDRRIKEEMPDDDEEMEEGGAGGSRKGTLLVLLRKFIVTVLFVIVTLIILSSIGVEIGPLLAGAGVFGLAIGFGAQTLVKDIISGIFFLIDDAFRVGDYVQTAGVKGMVEQISLRSLKLRHPRGMVNTIPFGDMGTVTNFSRDYIITKLDFRVRYDADVEKIRKIIKKKVYKPILKDEDLGPSLLGKIKSQGVREMDDSAMVMRVKFKTIPGEQFVIRKEVFRRMQEAFQEAGIQFAHRNVTVYLPPGVEETVSGEEKKKLLEGAAAAAASEETEQKAPEK